MDMNLCALLSAFLVALSISTFHVPNALLWHIFLAALFSTYLTMKLYRCFFYPFFISPLRHLPGPKDGHWLFGKMLHQLQTPGPNDMFLDMMRHWPDADFIRYLSIGNQEILLANSLQAQKEVQQVNSYAFQKSPIAARMFSTMSGTGLLFAEGDDHKRKRAHMNKAFAIHNLKKLVPVFQAKAEELCDNIRREIGGQAAAVLSVEPLLQKATIDVLVISTLGVDPDSLTSGVVPISKLYDKIIHQPALGHLITFIDGSIPVRSWLPLEINRRWLHDNAEVRRLLTDCIQRRIDEFAAGGNDTSLSNKDAKDLLTFMLEDRKFSVGHQWTASQLLDLLLNFIAGGHETMANVLVWVAHTLSVYPDIQSKLRREVNDMYAQHEAGWQPSYMDLELLQYLDHYLHEVLRVYSPALFLPRIAIHDVTICNVLLPKGTTVMVCPAAIHFNPSIWGSDALEFSPDRWGKDRGPANSPLAFESFMAGPRNCIGKTFAMLNLKADIVALVRSFRLAPPIGGKPVRFANPNFTLRPKESLRIHIEQIFGN